MGILAIGRMVGVCEKAATLLADAGVSARVLNMRWVKPLDTDAVAEAAKRHRLLVTVEENTSCGGFGAAVLETLSDAGLAVQVLRLSVPDCFVTHGAMSTLLDDIGLTPEKVSIAVLDRLRGLGT